MMREVLKEFNLLNIYKSNNKMVYQFRAWYSEILLSFDHKVVLDKETKAIIKIVLSDHQNNLYPI